MALSINDFPSPPKSSKLNMKFDKSAIPEIPVYEVEFKDGKMWHLLSMLDPKDQIDALTRVVMLLTRARVYGETCSSSYMNLSSGGCIKISIDESKNIKEPISMTLITANHNTMIEITRDSIYRESIEVFGEICAYAMEQLKEYPEDIERYRDLYKSDRDKLEAAYKNFEDFDTYSDEVNSIMHSHRYQMQMLVTPHLLSPTKEENDET